MNKRITSLLLCFVMAFAMLATAVPAFAQEGRSTYFKMTADKTEAQAGDTITYTVYLGPVEHIAGMKFKLRFPDGLSYVENSGKAADGIQSTLNAASAEFTESTKVWLVGSSDYTSHTETVLMTFQCTVKEGATGNQEVEIYIDDPDNICDIDYDNISYTITNATVTVTAAPKPATGIALNKSTLSLVVGGYETLTATVEPTDTTDTVAWSSDNASVATVDNNGKVSAIAAGQAKITAKAGDKTATCNVTVEKAPCTHATKTTVPKEASTCIEKGWDAYQKCGDCEKLFDMSGNEISGIPYKPLDTNAHDFDTTTWGYKGADGHAHLCKLNAAHHDTPVAHTPDRTAATETLPVKCTECGYVIEAQLGHTHNFNQQNTDSKFKATDATCTKPATYYYSCICGEKGTETFEYGSALDHTEGTAWEKDENYHWHICTVAGCGVVIESSKAAHTPDKTGGATYDYPILCSECGYVMEAQLEDSDIRIEVPFKLTVAKTGEKDPSAETFKFALSDFGAPVEIKIVTETVATDGAKTYDGSFVFTVKKSELGNLSEGFVLSQVKGDAEGWTYDETAYRVVPASGDEESIGTFRFFKVDAEDGDNGSETVMFTNSYNAKADAPKPDDTSKKDTETSPKTGDNSMLTLWVALLFVSGAALTGTTLYSRKKRTYNR